MRRICIWVEITGIVLAGFLPEDMNNILALYPIFAITAFQWGVFAGARGYSNRHHLFNKQPETDGSVHCRLYTDEGCKTERKGRILRHYTYVISNRSAGRLFAVNEWQVAGIWSCLIPLGLALTLVEVDVARKTQAKVVAHRTCSAPDR